MTKRIFRHLSLLNKFFNDFPSLIEIVFSTHQKQTHKLGTARPKGTVENTAHVYTHTRTLVDLFFYIRWQRSATQMSIREFGPSEMLTCCCCAG